jgi:uncharacterized membrane protein YhaH (DUF805 family)
MSSLFTFNGRLGRLAYFGYSLLLVLVGSVAALAVDEFLGGLLGFVLIVVIVIAMVWSGFSITARRLHDLDMSGWHYLWMIVIPAAITSWGQNIRADPITIIGGLLSLAFTLFLTFWPGTPGRNSYN